MTARSPVPSSDTPSEESANGGAEELRRRAALFEELFRRHAAVKLLIDPGTGAIIDANDAAVRFYGHSLESLRTMSTWDLNRRAPEENLRRLDGIRLGHEHELEAVHQRSDGELRNVAIYVGPVQVDGHQLLFATVHDVTDRVRAEAALKSSEARFEAMFEATYDAMFVADANTGRLVHANRRGCELAGRTHEDLMGRHHVELYAPESAERAANIFIRRVNEGMTTSAEYEVLRPNGDRVPVEVTARKTELPDGSLVMLGVFRDISERMAAERERDRLAAELRHAQKMEAIGQLAGGVAHDFNNILAAQMMNLGLLATRTDLPSEVHEALSEIMTGANLAADLTRQLLAFSRRQVLHVQRVELNALLGSLVKMLGRVVGERIAVELRASPEPLWMDADAGMTEQVVMNLVVNARDAMPSGGHLLIETRAVKSPPSDGAGGSGGRFACLIVTDTGTGMDDATLARVFEPFFTTKEVGKGTGLGLATVYGIVRQHRGRIEVESAPGAGSTFRVYWPAADEERPRLAGGPPRASHGGGEVLFLVEDEAPVRRSVSRGLRRLGYRVIEAETGDAALRLWAEHGPDVRLLITDMVMPGSLSGLELARRLRAETPGLGVIIASGYNEEMVRSGAPDDEQVRFLQKPFDLRTLAETVDELLSS